MRPIPICLAVLALISATWGLEPDEVFVVYNRRLPESRKLARYYVSKRKIPRGNLIGVKTTVDERISREEYVKTIQEPVKRALLLRNRLSRVKCLLTVKGVPLVINPAGGHAEKELLREAGKRCEEARGKLVALRNKLADSADDAEMTETLKTEVVEAEETLKQLDGARDEARQKFRASHGQSHAALDSELGLLFWPEYNLHRWLPNPLRTLLVRNAPPPTKVTLMTARLDGPDFESVRGIIDRSLATEKKGLEGIAYFDARGRRFKRIRPSAYTIYDEAIRRAAEMVRAHGIKTVLDNRPELFGPNDCPDAALYCGWYSLKKYVDAFDWAPGAVGYHIASGEAISLRRGNYWCKRMIDDKITATLGPVNEPYLSAFPDPRAFFGLLLTGEYTLGEVYGETSPWTSWMITLIGDPLYNPFKANPKMTLADVRAEISKPLRKPKADHGKPKAGQ